MRIYVRSTRVAMLLAYIDESHDKSTYWQVGLVCPEHTVAPLTHALDEVVRNAADNYAGVRERAELHGHDLFQGKADWSALEKLPRARIGVYNAAFTAIADHDVDILLRGVNIRRLNERYASARHPHDVTLEHLLERINDNSASRHGGQPLLVIADEIDRAQVHRRNLWRYQRFTTSGYRARQLTHIVDTMHFVPSDASRLVQAADLIVFLKRRRHADLGTDARAKRENERLWQRIEPRVVHEHCWHP
jgi:hypothetical protein